MTYSKLSQNLDHRSRTCTKHGIKNCVQTNIALTVKRHISALRLQKHPISYKTQRMASFGELLLSWKE